MGVSIVFNVTVAEASSILGVSVGRVHQLIRSGALDAEKVGGIWLVDRNSIETRLSSVPAAGRPSSHPAGKGQARYLLMSRNHPVLSFRFDSATGEFFNADEVMDSARAPLSVVSPRGKKASRKALAYWWGHRVIPKARHGIEEKLRELGIENAHDLPFRSMGLSLSDQYWVKPIDSNLDWADINFFENDFIEIETEEWLADVGLDSPDNTSDGVLSKRWVCRDGERRLLKGGTLLEQEPYNEVIATNLFNRLLKPEEYVPYRLEEWGGAVVSSCPNFLRSDEEFIPALYVAEIARRPEGRSSYRHYVECCERLGITDAETALGKMIVGDYVMANSDRHWRNFGIVRNVETLECRIAPLFDTGTSLWCHIPTRELPFASFCSGAKPFFEDANRQLRLVDDASWLDLDKLTGFPEWASDFLEENPAMIGRTDSIFEGIQTRIDRLRAIFG